LTLIIVTTSLGGIIELFCQVIKLLKLSGNDFIPETDEAKHIMGQAKAMRGYAYFYLAQLYQKEYNAEMILPIYTDTKFQISLKVLRLTFML
jgi:hypothetical protein